MEEASDRPDGFSEVIQPSQLPVTHRLLAGPRYNSVDTLMEDLNAWGRENGLAFVKTQASNYSEGKARRYTVICDRGRSRPSNAHSRKTSTTKTGCPWRGVAKALKANGWLWEFEISKAPGDSHNHEATTLLVTHSTHRGLTDEMKPINDFKTLISAPVSSAPTAGMRHRPTQPSGRRQRSFWEEGDDNIDTGFIPNATPTASAHPSKGTKSNNTKTKITKRTGRVGSKAAPKARHRRSSPDPLQDYNVDSVPRGDTQGQIVVALTGPDDEDEEGIEYDGEGEEGGGL